MYFLDTNVFEASKSILWCLNMSFMDLASCLKLVIYLLLQHFSQISRQITSFKQIAKQRQRLRYHKIGFDAAKALATRKYRFLNMFFFVCHATQL